VRPHAAEHTDLQQEHNSSHDAGLASVGHSSDTWHVARRMVRLAVAHTCACCYRAQVHLPLVLDSAAHLPCCSNVRWAVCMPVAGCVVCRHMQHSRCHAARPSDCAAASAWPLLSLLPPAGC
jgi:hypothetical protein